MFISMGIKRTGDNDAVQILYEFRVFPVGFCTGNFILRGNIHDYLFFEIEVGSRNHCGQLNRSIRIEYLLIKAITQLASLCYALCSPCAAPSASHRSQE